MSKAKYPIVYFIIATGGNLKKPSVQRIEISKEEVEEVMEDGETEQDAINYMLNEEIAVWEQSFSTAIALTKQEFDSLCADIKKIPG